MKTSTLIAASLISTAALARKRLVDEHGHQLESPNVEDCTTKCIFENETNSWCIES